MPDNNYFDTIFAQAGDVTSVPDPAQPSGSVSYDQGFPVSYSTPVGSGGLNFPRAQHNQILKDITSALQLMQQNGAFSFITTAMNGGVNPYSYNLGAICVLDISDGNGPQIWRSTAKNNTTTPGAGGSHWVPIGSTSNLFDGGTSTGSANTQIVTTLQGNFTNAAGNVVTWLSGFSNTSVMTLTVDGVTVNVKAVSQSGLRNTNQGDVIANAEYMAISDGTNLQLVNPSNALQRFNNLSDLGSLATALTNLGFSFSLSGGNLVAEIPNPSNVSEPLILQAGILTPTPSTSSQTLTFPLTFPNNLISFVDKPFSFADNTPSDNIDVGYWLTSSISTSGITFTYTAQRYWIAIGN